MCRCTVTRQRRGTRSEVVKLGEEEVLTCSAVPGRDVTGRHRTRVLRNAQPLGPMFVNNNNPLHGGRCLGGDALMPSSGTK